MHKVAAQFIAVALLGALLAALVIWVTEPRPSVSESSADFRRTTLEGSQSAMPPESVAPMVRSEISALPEELPFTEPTQSEQQGVQLPFESTSASAVGESSMRDAYEVDERASRTTPNEIDHEGTTADGDAGDRTPEESTETPVGWCSATTLARTGSDTAFVSDPDNVWSGSYSVFARPGSPGSLWQGVAALPYRGSRIAVSVYVQTPGDVRLVLVVGRERQPAPVPWLSRTIAFSQLQPGAAIGWVQLSVVGDVPEEADFLYYIVARSGELPLWVDDVQIAEVSPELPITGADRHRAEVLFVQSEIAVLPTPFNLGFETVGGNQEHASRPAESYCGNLRII